MNTIIAHPGTGEQANALKAVMKALKIAFEEVEGKPCNPEFVDKIKESRQQAMEGKVRRAAKSDFKEYLGLS